MITADTHVIIWEALKPQMLSKSARKAIDKANNSDGIIFCEISLLEIAMLVKKQRITVEISYLEFINLVLASNNYILKGITPEAADLSTSFPAAINQDPADRIIAATSILYNASLITADQNLRKSKIVKTIW